MITSILIAIVSLIITVVLCRRLHASVIPGMAIVMSITIIFGIILSQLGFAEKGTFLGCVSSFLDGIYSILLPLCSAAILFIYAFAVLKGEKVTLSHKIAFLVAVIIVASTVVLYMHYDDEDNSTVIVVTSLINFSSGFIPSMMIAYWISTERYKDYRNKHTENRYDYISVLGYRLNGDEMSDILVNRLDKALGYWERHGRCIPFYLSGGKCFAGTVTEASVMREYLLKKGVPDEQIHIESESTKTFENLRNISAMVGYEKKDVHCLIVTSNFHILRAVASAQKMGIHADAIAAHEPKKDRLYYSLMSREMMAFIFANPFLIIIYIETTLLIFMACYMYHYFSFTF